MAAYLLEDVDDVINELKGWSEGFMHGAQLSGEPHILIQTMSVLHEYHELLTKGGAISPHPLTIFPTSGIWSNN